MLNKLIERRREIYDNKEFIDQIFCFAKYLSQEIKKVKSNNKVLVCGNGGSASQASHFVAELMARYKLKNSKIFAMSLVSDTSVVSAIANDYDYDKIFSFQVENTIKEGDILVALTTSGMSENVNKAIEIAKEFNAKSFALLGNNGGKTKELADEVLVVPSNDTAVIQEIHLMVLHIICELI